MSANLRKMASQQNDKSRLSIQSTEISGRTVLALSGRMDAENAPQLQEECDELIAQGHTRLVIDLGGLTYVSSMGLRIFLAVAKTLQSEGGTLQLCRLKGLVRQIFEITGLTQSFSVHETLESAILEANS